MSNFLVFILNIFINSFLMFFTVVALIEIIIFLFRIQQGRFASTLRMLPIVKLLFDLFRYDFSRWSYLKSVNPLTAEEGTRTLSVMIAWPHTISDSFFLPIASIQLTVGDEMTFTIADMIGYSMDPLFLRVMCFSLLFYSAVSVFKKIFNDFHFIYPMKMDERHKKRKIHNFSINTFLRKNGSKIIFSSFSGSPFVVGLFSTQIHVPENLNKQLSRKEYEAVLAHEIEHIRYKDNLVRFVLSLICSAFWWIPTKWLQKRIEEGQEIGCDAKCRNYGIDPINLATAIYKSAKFSLNGLNRGFAHHLATHIICRRTHLLLQTKSDGFRKMHDVFYVMAGMIAFFVIFLGRFWIF